MLDAFCIQSEYIRLMKENCGEIIDDANRQINAMDDIHDLIEDWTDLSESFPYSEKLSA